MTRLTNPWCPCRYDLAVDVCLDDWSYTATEHITMRRSTLQATDACCFRLHAAPTIEILDVVGATITERDVSSHTILFKKPDDDVVDEFQLTLTFRHTIQEELRGFYRVSVKDPVTGETRRMASTHFEPVGARLFFVCQDEPAARADFALTASVGRQRSNSVSAADASPMVLLSNGPLEERVVTATKIQCRFGVVPQIPPYLCALVVGELEFIERVSSSGVPVRFYTTPGKTASATFALEAAVFSLEYFETFFHSPFPLPKLDLVAVPDFPIGGMENWGCICLVESCLLREDQASLAALKSTSNLVCHEVSHNWFGNLVGIDWWEGLWLKEGFASWCGFHATDKWKPTWGAMEEAVMDVQDALRVDMFEGSHPVEVPIVDPALITQVFDAISYDKGMAVVMMLQGYLGDDMFSQCLGAYIAKFKFQNTKTHELWEVMEEVSGKQIASMMGAFTTSKGYPLLEVSQGVESGTVQVRQCKCSLVTSAAAPGAIWTIPVTVAVEGEGGESLVVAATVAQETAVIAISAPLVKVNPKHLGFYRCSYSPELFDGVLKRFASLSYADRRGLISDVFATVEVRGSPDSVLELFHLIDTVTATEHHEAVLEPYIAGLERFADLFVASDDFDVPRHIASRGLRFLIPRAESLMIGSDVRHNLLRTTIVSAALRLLTHEGDTSHRLITWAVALADEFLDSVTTPREPDLLAAALEVAVAVTSDTFRLKERMWGKLQQLDKEPELCRIILKSLCKLPLTPFLEELAALCIDGTSTLVRSQYGGVIFLALSKNPQFSLWPFFQQNFAKIFDRWGGGQFRIQSIMESVGSTLQTDAEATEFLRWMQDHPIPNAKLSIQRAAEGVVLRSHLRRSLTSVVRSIL